MRRHRIITGYVPAVLALPETVTIAAAQAVSGSLPGGWRLGPATDGTKAASVEVCVGAAGISADPTTVRIRLPSIVASSAALAYVTYTALERVRQRQRMVTVHATALCKPDGKAVLLLGAKAAGKTSTALALAERGWTHAGDDLVVLGENDDGDVAIWPGKPIAAVRDLSWPLAAKPQRVLRPFAACPAPLGWVVRVAIHPTQTTAELTPALPLSLNEQLRLHENLARYISGLPTPLDGSGGIPYGPVWPLDTAELARWRSHLIARLAACRFDYLYAASADVAADLLVKETRTG